MVKNIFHTPLNLYFTFSLAELSTRDNFGLKYIPYPCGTVFDSLLSGVFPVGDNYNRKYIPYPCGTVFDPLPSGGFSQFWI